jgi:hypothetical protein
VLGGKLAPAVPHNQVSVCSSFGGLEERGGSRHLGRGQTGRRSMAVAVRHMAALPWGHRLEVAHDPSLVRPFPFSSILV